MSVELSSGANAGRGFAFWRLGLWVVLLLATFGCMQYLRHVQRVWPYYSGISATDIQHHAALGTMLAWDVAYFVISFAIIVLCAGGILRQPWARRPLRAVLGLQAAWMLVSGVMLWRQWLAWQQLQSSSGVSAEALAQADKGIMLALGFKLLAVPLLLWLAWRLGQPVVRAQFVRRR